MKKHNSTLAALVTLGLLSSAAATAGSWQQNVAIGGFNKVHLYTPDSVSAIGQGRGLLVVHKQRATWRCTGGCVLFSEAGSEAGPEQLGSKAQPQAVVQIGLHLRRQEAVLGKEMPAPLAAQLELPRLGGVEENDRLDAARPAPAKRLGKGNACPAAIEQFAHPCAATLGLLGIRQAHAFLHDMGRSLGGKPCLGFGPEGSFLR